MKGAKVGRVEMPNEVISEVVQDVVCGVRERSTEGREFQRCGNLLK